MSFISCHSFSAAPFRDSVLTKLLMNALGGNSKTVMVSHACMAYCMYTVHVKCRQIPRLMGISRLCMTLWHSKNPQQWYTKCGTYTRCIYMYLCPGTAFLNLVIGASRPLTGSPMGLPTFFFFFFSPRFPSAAENGISGGQTQWRKTCIDLVF